MIPDKPRVRRRSVFRGTLIVVATRWTDRSIGFISTLILARLLSPADFGLIALAMIVIGLVDVLLDVGVDIQLVRNPDATRDDFDTAWTIRIIQGTLAMCVILAASPYAGDYFNDRRITTILWVLAPTVVVGAISNIGIVNFQKDLAFGKEFQMLFARRLIVFLVTIGATLALRSYWGLVIGAITNTVAGAVLSYVIHEYRPRLSLSRAAEMFKVSTWLMLRSIGAYVSSQLDKAVLGRRASADITGAYKLADELAMLPTNDLLAPIGRALFPAFARDQDDPLKLRELFLLALGVSTLIVVPAGLGMALVADVAVLGLLGAKWGAAIPILQILGLTSMVAAFAHSPHNLLLAAGKFKALTFMTYLQIAAFLALAFSSPLPENAIGVALARLAATCLSIAMLSSLALHQARQIKFADCVKSTWRPVIAALAMAPAVHLLPTESLPALAQLLLKASVGAACYITVIGILWIWAGRPAGAEKYLLRKVRSPREALRA